MPGHPFAREIVEKHDPGIGSTDASLCLPGWIDSFCEWHLRGEGYTLSKHQVTAILHTLVAARERAARLVRERDEARACIPAAYTVSRS